MSARLSADAFFEKLAALFAHKQGQDYGSVHLVQKQLTSQTDTPDSEPSAVLIRASNAKSKEQRAKKVKLSTVVRPDELEGFYARYAEVCKAGMTALKKRDRKGRKAKKKAKTNV